MACPNCVGLLSNIVRKHNHQEGGPSTDSNHVVSSSGTPIPLQVGNDLKLNCHLSPYFRRHANAKAVRKSAMQKIDDHDRIGGAFGYIESLNLRLVNFRLELKVIPLQKNLDDGGF
ncbi:MAG TPA: hypothetical protein VFG90_04340 [Nitrososphaeraceae archaeon]|nr:hypothetical protein [Nitrososphaeraceae archaeon]